MPDFVSTAIVVLAVKPLSKTNCAKQRAPLPHCATSPPSALKMRYLKSAPLCIDFSTNNN